MSWKKAWRLGIALLVLVAGGVGVSAGLEQLRGPERGIPTTRVARGTIALRVHTKGELRAARSVMLAAPSVGGTLQIVHLLKTGMRVKAGDVVIEFDPSEQEYNLEQSRSELLQAEQEILKGQADAEVQAAQDKVAVLKAKFDVRRAELEMSRNELVSAIDAKKNLLNLEEAQRRLEQLEEDIKSRQASNQATLAVLEERRNKARLGMVQAQQNIENMKVRAPMTGLVAVKDNQNAAGGFFFTGMVLPEYRQGDLVWPGSPIVDVLETEQMEILAKVAENDRSNVNPGQTVEVQVDAAPGQSYTGKVKTVAGLAARGYGWGGDAMRKFDATFQLDRADERLRPGVTAQLVVLGEQVKDALHLPPQAIFEKDGKPVVYVKNGANFEAREVKVACRTESQVVVEGITEGTEVALSDPEKQTKKATKSAGPMTPAAGGGGQ